jgi:hypothetical protein
MRIICVAMSIGAMAAGLLSADDTITVFDKTWTVPSLQDWQVAVDQGKPMLRLLIGREPAPGPRRPSQFALLAMPLTKKVTLEADARPIKSSLIVVYAYRDSAHFDYVHFSVDTGMKQPVHNGVFHVYGGERVRISNTIGVAAFSATNRWYRLKLEWDGTSGNVQGFVDGQAIPALHAVDLSLTEGRVGIGSFDETGDFKDVRVIAAP